MSNLMIEELLFAALTIVELICMIVGHYNAEIFAPILIVDGIIMVHVGINLLKKIS